MSHSYRLTKEFGGLSVDGLELSGKEIYSDLTAATTLTASDSGKTFYLNAATEFAVTLPPVASCAGFKAKFVVKAAPSGASYTVASAAADIHGLIMTSQDAGGSGASTAGTPITTISLVDSVAVVGDFIEVVSDGTNFYVSGQSSAFGAITFA